MKIYGFSHISVSPEYSPVIRHTTLMQEPVHEQSIEEIDTRTMATYESVSDQARSYMNQQMMEEVLRFSESPSQQDSDFLQQAKDSEMKLSVEFAQQRKFDVSKTVKTDKPKFRIITELQPYGFKKTVIPEPKLKTITQLQPFGYTKTVFAQKPAENPTGIVKTNISVNNDLFDTNLDSYLNQKRQ